MLTIGWLAVAVGVLAMLWADGRFPFSPANLRSPSTGDRHPFT
jgi:hypothetical protein